MSATSLAGSPLWAGVFPATLCPFHADESIDEEGLRDYIAELAAVDGVDGLTCNGHTGEVMSLRPAERNRVTQIVAETAKAAGRTVKTISGVSVEGSLEGIDHALAAKEVGADAILLMPPHHWLRFGRSSQTAVGFFEDVASAGIDIVVHQYPAWTQGRLYARRDEGASADSPSQVHQDGHPRYEPLALRLSRVEKGQLRTCRSSPVTTSFCYPACWRRPMGHWSALPVLCPS